MRLINLLRATGIAATAIALGVGVSVSAHASTNPPQTTQADALATDTDPASVAENPVVGKVIRAADPRLAYESLTASEREEFDRLMAPATTEELPLSHEPLDQDAQQSKANGDTPEVEPTSSAAAARKKNPKGCWKTSAHANKKARGGNTLFTYWVTLEWCSTGKKVNKATLLEADGETSTPLWRYEGVKTKGAVVMSDQWARAFAKHRFILGLGGFDVSTSDVCVRAIGTIAGPNSTFADEGCGLHT